MRPKENLNKLDLIVYIWGIFYL